MMHSYSQLRRRRWILRPLFLIALSVMIWLTAGVSKVDLSLLTLDRLWALKYVRGFLTPAWEAFPLMLEASLQTILLALLGTLFGALFSLGFAFLAATNLSHPFVSAVARLLIALERAVSPIIIILLLIVIFGPGMFAGVLTLTISCLGMLGRLYAHAMEEVDPRQLESLKAHGAGWWQRIKYGIMPQILPAFLSFTILRFEINIRASVMLGAIGAGGVGYELIEAYYHIDYPGMTIAILAIMLLVFGAERLSEWIQVRIQRSLT